MTKAHTDVGPELRRLAQAILDGIDPAVRVAAAWAAGGRGSTGKCQQVWCPVCALAAVVAGEQHPLMTVIADHSVALLEVVRALVDGLDRSAPPLSDDPPGGGVASTGIDDDSGGRVKGKTRYQPIPVTFSE